MTSQLIITSERRAADAPGPREAAGGGNPTRFSIELSPHIAVKDAATGRWLYGGNSRLASKSHPLELSARNGQHVATAYFHHFSTAVEVLYARTGNKLPFAHDHNAPAQSEARSDHQFIAPTTERRFTWKGFRLTCVDDAGREAAALTREGDGWMLNVSLSEQEAPDEVLELLIITAVIMAVMEHRKKSKAAGAKGGAQGANASMNAAAASAAASAGAGGGS